MDRDVEERHRAGMTPLDAPKPPETCLPGRSAGLEGIWGVAGGGERPMREG